MGTASKLNTSIRTTDVPVVDLLTFMSTDGRCGRRALGLGTERVVRELGIELLTGDDKMEHRRIEQSLLDLLQSFCKPPKLKCIAYCYLAHPKATLSERVRQAVEQFEHEARNVEIIYEARKMC